MLIIYSFQIFSSKKPIKIIFCRKWFDHFLHKNDSISVCKTWFIMTSLGPGFYIMLEIFKCSKVFYVPNLFRTFILAKIYITTFTGLFFLFQPRSFCHQVFLESNFLPFSLFPFNLPFFIPSSFLLNYVFLWHSFDQAHSRLYVALRWADWDLRRGVQWNDLSCFAVLSETHGQVFCI